MNRHLTDTLSLIAGLVFVTLGGVWLLDDVITLSWQATALVFAGVFLLAGLVGLIRAVRRPRADGPGDADRRSLSSAAPDKPAGHRADGYLLSSRKHGPIVCSGIGTVVPFLWG